MGKKFVIEQTKGALINRFNPNKMVTGLIAVSTVASAVHFRGKGIVVGMVNSITDYTKERGFNNTFIGYNGNP